MSTHDDAMIERCNKQAASVESMSDFEYDIGDYIQLKKKGREGYIRWRGEIDDKDGLFYGIEIFVGSGILLSLSCH